MIQIQQSNRSKQTSELEPQLEDTATRLLNFVFAQENIACDGEVSLSFIDDEEMRELNLQYRQIDQTTDVLSFSIDDQPDENGYRMLGDIVISIPCAERYAHSRGVEPREELETLIVHGALHLLGYDDEDEDEREKMLMRQTEILNAFYSASAAEIRKRSIDPTRQD